MGQLFTFLDFPNISFESPDKKTFRCLELAYTAGKMGGTYPAVLNASNDIAVERFLKGDLPFYKIPEVIEKTLSAHKNSGKHNLENIIDADRWAREYASKIA
ncbi:MAG: 1-deoxy-D-xylulose 5-phosphate reductoisomerase [Candidatus Daviesbacteria bacterium GW2011_GWA1_36_8]|uniref:1-deoxy-D-xylulose 5-phosphate reductoisomerase n=1 Tax=Candidatus Daviesbacteria bacterium GW2011_GWA1_36_8 TaxID=1618417 RepID=A0A0G0FQR0_9BACT|nr:MAG: 1-deoxy-D-xylulose 5-phosphate reductoisomerase [Candidatus Daviesbacteria bacterium GW2011_GWA1_36_8]